MLNSLVATSIGIFIGAAVTNQSAATNIQSLALAPFILFSGISTNLGSIFVWLRWLQYLSPMRYAMEILIRNEFGGKNLGFENPVDALYYNFGTGNCVVVLLVMALLYRVLSIILLKLSARAA
mmetsp:Transcript_17559/g.20353  ORF Transcript_17559/g.20353 Transcript_17559/m.20353 type:complete len:123 (-) Transcript_17559:80-448(-)